MRRGTDFLSPPYKKTPARQRAGAPCTNLQRIFRTRCLCPRELSSGSGQQASASPRAGPIASVRSWSPWKLDGSGQCPPCDMRGSHIPPDWCRFVSDAPEAAYVAAGAFRLLGISSWAARDVPGTGTRFSATWPPGCGANEVVVGGPTDRILKHGRNPWMGSLHRSTLWGTVRRLFIGPPGMGTVAPRPRRHGFPTTDTTAG